MFRGSFLASKTSLGTASSYAIKPRLPLCQWLLDNPHAYANLDYLSSDARLQTLRSRVQARVDHMIMLLESRSGHCRNVLVNHGRIQACGDAPDYGFWVVCR